MSNIFAMGACRIQSALQTMGYPIYDCWYYTHTISQAIQAFRYFNGELQYTGDIYDLVKVLGNENYPPHPKIETLISSFYKADVLFLEIQTTKNYEYDGFFLNQVCEKARQKEGVRLYQDSKQDLKNKMRIIEDTYPCPVVFVAHVLCDRWLQSMPFLKERRVIEEAIIEFCLEKPSRLMFTPSTVIDIYGDQMMLTTQDGNVDINHYSKFGNTIVAKEFDKIINKVLQT